MAQPIWPIIWPIGTEPTDDDLKARAEMFAGAVMRHLTAGRVGNVSITVMPCGGRCAHPRDHGDPFHPVLLESGQMANCFCHGGCSCESAPRVYLDGPVGSITQVMIDGEVVPDTAYRVENGTWLTRTDGKGWPSCSGDKFTVTYMQGNPVDLMGQIAGGVLAVEYVKLINEDKKCRLPQGVRSINRAGISIEIESGIFPGGRTGMQEIDSYLIMWNPYALKTAPTVHSPDRRRNRQVTWRA